MTTPLLLNTKLPSTMRVIVLLVVISAAFAAPNLQIRPPQMGTASRIIGGHDIPIQSYPFMTSMQFNHLGVVWIAACGGALITRSTILSAAYCYHGDSPSQWRVRVGSAFAYSGGIVYNVQSVLPHPNYNHNTLANDVAIVRLTSQVFESNTIGIAFIVSNDFLLSDGTEVTVLGWGDTVGDNTHSETLKRANVNIINRQVCALRYASLKTMPGFEHLPDVTNNMICAGILNVGGRDTCQGDYGGPLLYDRHAIYGVASWGSCGHNHYPGVYSRISVYSDWIIANGAG